MTMLREKADGAPSSAKPATERYDLEIMARLEGAEWWADFIEYFVERGADRHALTEAVSKFRSAQDLLADAIADGGYFVEPQ